MTEPTDTEILEFLLNQFQAHNLQMNGESDWVFMNGGSRMNHLKLYQTILAHSQSVYH